MNVEFLEKLGACKNMVGWVKTQKSPQEAWDNCEAPNWMIWYLYKTNCFQPKLMRQLIEMVEAVVDDTAVCAVCSSDVVDAVDVADAIVAAAVVAGANTEAAAHAVYVAVTIAVDTAVAAAAHVIDATAYIVYSVTTTAIEIGPFTTNTTQKEVQTRIADLIRTYVPKVPKKGADLQRETLQREDRLQALGYEELSDEERKHRLNQNIAMLDWPKVPKGESDGH